jgi:phenylpropionate dioxygenase-like ring-hydroxylating dioxygenase large terminal subunit
VRPVRYFGEDLVLYRDATGAAVLVDAYCPHMGAHLGYGGCVDGDGLRCPFHNWRFDASGRCTEAPYSTRPDAPDASLRTWDVREVDGLILVRYDGSGRGIDWQLPRRPEFGMAGWFGYESASWTVRMHVQEVAENVPDTSHFLYVHTVPTLPVAEVEIDRDVWRQKTVGRTDDGVETWGTEQEMFGLGLIWLCNRGPAKLRFLTAVTPIDEQYAELRLLYLSNEGPDASGISPESKAQIEMISENTGRDVPIWEHKTYRTKPHLVPGDGPIGRLRHWARQFYADEAAVRT